MQVIEVDAGLNPALTPVIQVFDGLEVAKVIAVHGAGPVIATFPFVRGKNRAVEMAKRFIASRAWFVYDVSESLRKLEELRGAQNGRRIYCPA